MWAVAQRKVCTFYQRSESYEQLERKTDTAASGWRYSGILNAERTMDDTFIKKHMFEEK
jgi:hypothetical protein